MIKLNLLNKNNFCGTLSCKMISFVNMTKFFFNKHHEFQTYKTMGLPHPKRVKSKHIYPKKVPKIEEEIPVHQGHEDTVPEIPLRLKNYSLEEVPKLKKCQSQVKRGIYNRKKNLLISGLKEEKVKTNEDIVDLPEKII